MAKLSKEAEVNKPQVGWFTRERSMLAWASFFLAIAIAIGLMSLGLIELGTLLVGLTLAIGVGLFAISLLVSKFFRNEAAKHNYTKWALLLTALSLTFIIGSHLISAAVVAANPAAAAFIPVAGGVLANVGLGAGVGFTMATVGIGIAVVLSVAFLIALPKILKSGIKIRIPLVGRIEIKGLLRGFSSAQTAAVFTAVLATSIFLLAFTPVGPFLVSMMGAGLLGIFIATTIVSAFFITMTYISKLIKGLVDTYSDEPTKEERAEIQQEIIDTKIEELRSDATNPITDNAQLQKKREVLEYLLKDNKGGLTAELLENMTSKEVRAITEKYSWSTATPPKGKSLPVQRLESDDKTLIQEKAAEMAAAIVKARGGASLSQRAREQETEDWSQAINGILTKKVINGSLMIELVGDATLKDITWEAGMGKARMPYHSTASEQETAYKQVVRARIAGEIVEMHPVEAERAALKPLVQDIFSELETNRGWTIDHISDISPAHKSQILKNALETRIMNALPAGQRDTRQTFQEQIEEGNKFLANHTQLARLASVTSQSVQDMETEIGTLQRQFGRLVDELNVKLSSRKLSEVQGKATRLMDQMNSYRKILTASTAPAPVVTPAPLSAAHNSASSSNGVAHVDDSPEVKRPIPADGKVDMRREYLGKVKDALACQAAAEKAFASLGVDLTEVNENFSDQYVAKRKEKLTRAMTYLTDQKNEITKKDLSDIDQWLRKHSELLQCYEKAIKDVVQEERNSLDESDDATQDWQEHLDIYLSDQRYSTQDWKNVLSSLQTLRREEELDPIEEEEMDDDDDLVSEDGENVNQDPRNRGSTKGILASMGGGRGNSLISDFTDRPQVEVARDSANAQRQSATSSVLSHRGREEKTEKVDYSDSSNSRVRTLPSGFNSNRTNDGPSSQQDEDLSQFHFNDDDGDIVGRPRSFGNGGRGNSEY